jgi:peroxiredoxin
MRTPSSLLESRCALACSLARFMAGALRFASCALLLVAMSACTQQSTDTSKGLQPGDLVPDVELRTLSGERLQLGEFDGPVLVNFWSTDCHICIEETPMLTALWEQLRDEGYSFVAVAMPHDRPDSVVKLIEQTGWKHPVAIDISGDVLAAFENVVGTPTSFLITRDGTLDARIVGRVDGAELEARVRALL